MPSPRSPEPAVGDERPAAGADVDDRHALAAAHRDSGRQPPLVGGEAARGLVSRRSGGGRSGRSPTRLHSQNARQRPLHQAKLDAPAAENHASRTRSSGRSRPGRRSVSQRPSVARKPSAVAACNWEKRGSSALTRAVRRPTRSTSVRDTGTGRLLQRSSHSPPGTAEGAKCVRTTERPSRPGQAPGRPPGARGRR
jgi:hypothetical protein